MKKKLTEKSTLDAFKNLTIKNAEKIKGGNDGDIIINDDVLVG